MRGAMTLQVRQLQSIDLAQLEFVGDALTCLRQEVDGKVCRPCLPARLLCTYKPVHLLLTFVLLPTSCVLSRQLF